MSTPCDVNRIFTDYTKAQECSEQVPKTVVIESRDCVAEGMYNDMQSCSEGQFKVVQENSLTALVNRAGKFLSKYL
jgi:hypothetical protein